MTKTTTTKAAPKKTEAPEAKAPGVKPEPKDETQAEKEPEGAERAKLIAFSGKAEPEAAD